MNKFDIETRIKIFYEYQEGANYQSLAKKYNMNFSNLRYMIRYIELYGWEEYKKPQHYSRELKLELIERVISEQDSIFNIALEGGLKSRTQLQTWVTKYKQNGYNIDERKQVSSMLKKENKNQNESIEEENIRLRRENKKLKAELEYSKKLRAVVQARKSQQQKKK